MKVHKVGSYFERPFTREEAPVVKTIEYLINFRPKDIHQELFEGFNSEYAWSCY